MPRAPKQSGRHGCPARVRGRSYCDEHQPEAWTGSLNPGSTRATRELHQAVIDEEPVCTRCRRAPSTEAGHVIARAFGGHDVRENLTGQCRPCNLEQLREDLALARARG